MARTASTHSKPSGKRKWRFSGGVARRQCNDHFRRLLFANEGRINLLWEPVATL